MSHHTIEIDGQSYSYTIKRYAQSKRMKLTVHKDRSIVVTAPLGVPTFLIRNLVSRNKCWIYEQVTKTSTSKPSNFSNLQLAYPEYKETAREIITKRVVELNKPYGYKYNRIAIRNQKTRWGSCSRKKNLNFNYKIIFLPEKLRDYIIVHEICHLAQMNHSQKFWGLVAITFPDHNEIRKELRRIGTEIM